MIKENLSRLRQDFADACRLSGRKPEEVTLVGVTKFISNEDIQEAIDAGLTDIAENRVQEAEKKFVSLSQANPKIKRHLIGHLQSNKAKDAIAVCDLIQSVDSIKLIQEIEKQALKINKSVDVLLQFNTAHEPQKFGADPSEALPLLECVGRLTRVRVLGLMAMAPFTEDQGIIRRTFADLRGLRDLAVKNFSGHPAIEMKYLSMGMSSDYTIAIEEGSNMVRVGSALFKKEEGK
ncbi:MAG: YggS family pyridoxal phosphate-dependent enzyme [Candidatus Omnitrophica bacterium]|nr:YggS family pyridoxal phosphate-dependent enzyme [Candidatus Omnitrophota bacterium]